MGPKIFTVREANGLIPKIESVFADLDKVRARLKQVKSKMDLLEMLWGEEIHVEQNPDHREYQHYTSDVDKLKQEFDAHCKKLADMEVMLKSIEQGLLDFYGVIDGRLVFLCWKRGEVSVEFYHHLEDGFAGRQPIPEKELAK